MNKGDSALVVVVGSLAAVAKADGVSLAESFVGADAIVIVDCSASMGDHDGGSGKTRYERALEEIGRLQADLPGKVAVIAFSSDVQFCPGGCPPFLCQNTDLAKALRFAKVADVAGMKFVVVSDGCPDDCDEAMRVGRGYKAHISTVFVGPEDDHEEGRAFLAKLAAASGGAADVAHLAHELAVKTERLLLNQGGA